MQFFSKFIILKIISIKGEGSFVSEADRCNMQIYKMFNSSQQCKLLTSQKKKKTKF